MVALFLGVIGILIFVSWFVSAAIATRFLICVWSSFVALLLRSFSETCVGTCWSIPCPFFFKTDGKVVCSGAPEPWCSKEVGCPEPDWFCPEAGEVCLELDICAPSEGWAAFVVFVGVFEVTGDGTNLGWVAFCVRSPGPFWAMPVLSKDVPCWEELEADPVRKVLSMAEIQLFDILNWSFKY